MQHQTLPIDVCELLDACIDSIEALDTLLLLLRDPGRWWSLPELANAIDAGPEAAGAAVCALRTRGLAAETAPNRLPAGSLVRLASLDALAQAAFGALARACTTQRAAAVEHLSRRSMARYRVLADAFTRARAT